MGLSNYGNMCFLNSILQSLLHNDPLINLFNKLYDRIQTLTYEEAPFLVSMCNLFSEHEFLETKISSEGSLSRKLPPITPESLYECIKLKSNSQSFQGAQEDAQEFLTFLFDQLHEELLRFKKFLNWKLTGDLDRHRSNSNTDDEAKDDEWLQVGKNKKISITRSVFQNESPISFLFFGRFKSVVKRSKMKDSITTEPFHCISLDIQGETISNITDALLSLSSPELIETNLSKTLTIERLPPILTFQLKRFLYNPFTGVEKLNKFVTYPEKLEVPLNVLNLKSGSSAPVYRLASVIYHHGRTADGGHYTCHVRQTMKDDDDDLWIHYDDTSFSSDNLSTVLKEKSSWQNAYLIMYIRQF